MGKIRIIYELLIITSEVFKNLENDDLIGKEYKCFVVEIWLKIRVANMTGIKKIVKKVKNYQVEGYSDNYSKVVHKK